MIAIWRCLRVNLPEREWWIDLPELTTIRLGESAFQFKYDDGSQLIMRSGWDGMKWCVDLPKLTSLVCYWRILSWSFENPRRITLEGSSNLVTITSRHAVSHWSALRPSCLLMQVWSDYKSFLFFESFMSRYHSRSGGLSSFLFFLHTQFHPHIQSNSDRMHSKY